LPSYGNLAFPTKLLGNTFGYFNGTTGAFRAPVSGRFYFGLNLEIYNGPKEYYYYLYMRRNGSIIHSPDASGTRGPSNYDSRHFSY